MDYELAAGKREVIEWMKSRHFIAIVIAALILAVTGISLTHVPRHEVLYSENALRVKLNDGGASVIYIMEFGNTGRLVQDTIRIVLARKAVDRCALKPKFQNFGVTARPVKTVTNDDNVTYTVTDLEPGARVKLTFVLIYKQGEPEWSWQDILRKIDPAEGAARPGDPAFTSLGRALFAIFN